MCRLPPPPIKITPSPIDCRESFIALPINVPPAPIVVQAVFGAALSGSGLSRRIFAAVREESAMFCKVRVSLDESVTIMSAPTCFATDMKLANVAKP